MNYRIVFIQCLGFSEMQMINFYTQQRDYKNYMKKYGEKIANRFEESVFKKLNKTE